MTKFCGTRKRKLVHRNVAELIPYARNSRTHSEAQVDQIAASITEFGWTNPLLIDEAGNLIAGHGRLLAAAKLGIVQAPCIVVDGLSDAQRRALVIADNKLAENAGWDESLLAAELEALLSEEFDVGLLGFNEDEIAALLADKTEGLTDPDDVPEAPAEPVTRPGDVWLLGKHRIVCGDSTDADTVAKCLNGIEPHLMVTDPPYGVEYDASWRNEVGASANGYQRVNAGGKKQKSYAGRALGKVENDDRADWTEAWALFPGDVAYVWHAGTRAAEVAASLGSCGFEVRAQIIWNKSILVIGRGHYHPKHEPLWYAVRKGATGHWNGDKKPTTVWDIDKPRASETGHSTQKPVECMKRPIENNSSAGQAVYEPFSGSGTTIIAGEMTGRSVHAIELSPAYVDVAVIRWQEFTGGEAALEADGRTFAAVAASRATDARKAA